MEKLRKGGREMEGMGVSRIVRGRHIRIGVKLVLIVHRKKVLLLRRICNINKYKGKQKISN